MQVWTLRKKLRASLQEFFVSTAIEIRENGGRLSPEPPVSWEVRGGSGKPLLHLWGENGNITRRVIAITDQSEESIALAVERFGRPRPERLEMVRVNFQPRRQGNLARRLL
jgi:hypothetical protein